MKRIGMAILLVLPSVFVFADETTGPARGRTVEGKAQRAIAKGIGDVKPLAESIGDCGIPTGCAGWPSGDQPSTDQSPGSRKDGYSLGAHVGYCVAYQRYKERCTDCQSNLYGKYECMYAEYPGYCGCDQVQRAGAAPGITDCKAYPSYCQYQW